MGAMGDPLLIVRPFRLPVLRTERCASRTLLVPQSIRSVSLSVFAL